MEEHKKKRRSPIKVAPRGFLAINKLVSRAIGKVLTKARGRDKIREKRLKEPEKYKKINLDATRKFYKDHPERVREWNNEWQRKNHGKLREWDRNRRKERRKSDTHYTLKGRLRTRIQCALKRKNVGKTQRTNALLGMDIEEFKADFLVPGFHIDHIFPFDLYDLENEEQQRKVCNYSNLQMLKPKENRNKASKLPTKAMAAKVARWAWPDGVTEDMLPDIYDGWATPLRMRAPAAAPSSPPDAN